MHDLKRLSDKEFSDHLMNTIQQLLDKGKSKLDPKEFRTLYINKNYSSNNSDFQGANKKKQRQLSTSVSNNNN